MTELGEPARFANEAGAASPGEEVQRYLVGGHSVVLQEKLWDAIAGYILGGDMELPPDVEMTHDHPWWIDYPARVAPLIWVVIAALLIWILHQIVGLPIAEWQRSAAVIAYLSLLWVVLTQI